MNFFFLVYLYIFFFFCLFCFALFLPMIIKPTFSHRERGKVNFFFLLFLCSIVSGVLTNDMDELSVLSMENILDMNHVLTSGVLEDFLST